MNNNTKEKKKPPVENRLEEVTKKTPSSLIPIWEDTSRNRKLGSSLRLATQQKALGNPPSWDESILITGATWDPRSLIILTMSWIFNAHGSIRDLRMSRQDEFLQQLTPGDFPPLLFGVVGGCSWKKKT
ncbi:hypothetical protein TNCV_852131 [Trichonephila clavipes]|nr:hypothetical protein TNCV_852131 [Trichonephila clavipes]